MRTINIVDQKHSEEQNKRNQSVNARRQKHVSNDLFVSRHSDWTRTESESTELCWFGPDQFTVTCCCLSLKLIVSAQQHKSK